VFKDLGLKNQEVKRVKGAMVIIVTRGHVSVTGLKEIISIFITGM
jgi:hypothetical protein